MQRSAFKQVRKPIWSVLLTLGLFAALVVFTGLACSSSSNDSAPNGNDGVDMGAADFPTPGDDHQSAQGITPTQTPRSSVQDAAIPFEAVVQIITLYLEDGEYYIGWTGSGTVISPDGLILTNAHVVLPDRYFNVDALAVAFTIHEDQSPEALYFAEVLQADAALDVAVIRITEDIDENPVDYGSLDLPYVPLGDANTMRLGDPITILGYPGIGGDTITLTRGEVSGFTSEEGRGDRAFIKTSATIAGGNSGGLAADVNGFLIGIPTQLGYGGEDQFVDCRVLADTNRDGYVDDKDSCIPTGGFINALRPINLAMPLIEAARKGNVSVVEGDNDLPAEGMPEVGETLFFDDFSTYDEWWEWADETSAIYYSGEALHFELIEENYIMWREDGYEYQDVIVDVDAFVVSPAGDGDFGLMCRYQDAENFYGLEVSEDGYFSIWKYADGEFSYMWEEEWRYLPFELDFKGGVHLTAACIGDHLYLAVDGELLAEVVDESLAYGSAGMIAGTWEEPNLIVGFDNYTISIPAD